MKIVTSSQMSELDRLAIEKHKISALFLMERAGIALANATAGLIKRGRVFVLCGKGNNGGDGLVAARHLLSMGFNVSAAILGSSADLSPCSRANYDRLLAETVRVYSATSVAEFTAIVPHLVNSDCIVDAIFGTGLLNAPTGIYAIAIDQINSLKAKVVSADVPSGLCSDTGRAYGKFVKATMTVTFGLPKIGLFFRDGEIASGKISIADIGIPPSEIAAVDTGYELLEPSMFPELSSSRRPNSHKGDYGHVCVFAGSKAHLGAGYLASLAALRAGCGLATLGMPDKSFQRFDARFPEIMCEAISDDGLSAFTHSSVLPALKLAEGKSVCAIGPAIGTMTQTAEFLNSFSSQVNCPLVIDADGLNCLSLDSLKQRKCPTIVTPHPKEMARLCGLTVEEILSDREAHATRIAKTYKCTVVLKGKNTIVADSGKRVLVNPFGNPGMATAGMGDALTGIIASFIAQRMKPIDAAAAGVMVHAMAGDLALKREGERALITSDVIKSLGEAFTKIASADLT